jgi:hypothetical protein
MKPLKQLTDRGYEGVFELFGVMKYILAIKVQRRGLAEKAELAPKGLRFGSF